MHSIATSQWANYVNRYTQVTKVDLVRKMRKAARLTKFRSPVQHAYITTTPPLNTTTQENRTMGSFSDSLSGRHTIDIPGNGITQPGIDAISCFLRLMDISLPNDWQWVWQVGGKGEYVGTLPKRIGKYAHKCKHKLLPEALSYIGNLGMQHCEKTETYDFEFVDKFDWNAGDFGDQGSCFWSCHKSAKDILLDNGAGAICFYHPETNDGYARAWIVPLSDSAKNKCFIVFNGYGIDTLPIARILATYLGHAYYQKIGLTNKGGHDGDLYINGGRGYLIGPQDIVKESHSIDLDWDEPNGLRCEKCGDRVDEDDCCLLPDGDTACETCYRNKVSFCQTCQEDCWREDERLDPNGDCICCNCHEDSVSWCGVCEEEYWNDDGKTDDAGRTLCEECYNKQNPVML